ncbi:hypothetical protein AB4212_19720, partial [Streptomyces sp. 2MCAF27]
AGEPPGRLTARLTVYRAGRALLDQELGYGPGTPGWDGGAVLAGHRAAGQLLLIDPAFEERPVSVRQLGETAVLYPLAGPAALVTAVAPDALRLRRLLDDAADGDMAGGDMAGGDMAGGDMAGATRPGGARWPKGAPMAGCSCVDKETPVCPVPTGQ